MRFSGSIRTWKTPLIGGLIAAAMLLGGCGGGSGSSTKKSDTASVIDLGVFGDSSITNFKRNPLRVKIKSLTIKRIDLAYIGDAKAKYLLDKQTDKEAAYAALTPVGGGEANLSNASNPVRLKNGRFYHIDTTFDIVGTYPDGVDFEVVLVEQNGTHNDTNVTSYTLLNKTIDLDTEGEEHFEADVLIPYSIDIAHYLLVVHLVDAGLEQMIHSDDSITDIPQMGAIYADIDFDMNRQTVTVLDINSSPYIDLPTHMQFDHNITRDKIADGSLLFSNVGTYPKGVTISAKLKIEGENDVDLYLLNSETGRIAKEVHYTIPSKENQTQASQRLSKSYVSDFGSDFIDPAAQLGRDLRPRVDVHFTQGVEQNYGDKRYNIDIACFLPQNKYADVVSALPNLSKNINTNGAKGTIEWHVKVDHVDLLPVSVPHLASQFVPTLSLMDINLSMFQIQNIISQIVTVDAALYIDDNHAYLFKQDKYARVDMQTKKITGNWHPINEKWPGVIGGSDGIDRVDAVWYDGWIHFVRNNKIVTFDPDQNKVLHPVLGTRLDNLFGVGDKMPFQELDAAFYDRDAKTLYFIHDKKYFAVMTGEKLDEHLKYKTEGPEKVSNKWGDISTAGAMGLPNQLTLFWNIIGQSALRINRPDVFLDKHTNDEQNKGDRGIASLELKAQWGILSRWYVPGVLGYATSSLDFYLFDHRFSLIAADGKIAASAQTYHPLLKSIFKEDAKVTYQYGAMLSLSVLDKTIWKKGEIKEGHIDFNNQPVQQNAYPPNSNPETEIYAFNKEWNEKLTLFNVHFPVGPVVVQVTGGIDGGVGLHFGLYEAGQGVGAKLDSAIVLSNSSDSAGEGLSVFFTGGIDEAVVHAGIRGDVRLVMAKLNGTLASGLTTKDQNLDFSLNAEINFQLRMIQAGVSLYAGTRTHIEWCKSWGIPYPCGLGWDDFTYELYSTPWLFQRNWKLLDEDIPLVSIPLINP